MRKTVESEARPSGTFAFENHVADRTALAEGRSSRQLRQSLRSFHPRHVDDLLRILDPFFGWMPHISPASQDVRVQAKAGVFWARDSEVRVLVPHVWLASDSIECAMDVSRMEASMSSFFDEQDLQTQTRRLQGISSQDMPMGFFAWLGYPFDNPVDRQLFGVFRDSLLADLSRYFGRRHGRVAYDALMPLIYLSCLFVLRDMQAVARMFEPLRSLWLSGMPCVGIDEDLRIMVLAHKPD